MIRRILMAILIACLAVPAVAMPIAHDTGAMTAKGHCDDSAPASQEDGTAIASHGCIGCLAPFRLEICAERPFMVRSLAPMPLLVAQRRYANDAPEPPPPRA